MSPVKAGSVISTAYGTTGFCRSLATTELSRSQYGSKVTWTS